MVEVTLVSGTELAKANVDFLNKSSHSSPLLGIWNKITHPTQALFERGKGYWSSPADESNENFFNRLTDKKSQREDWYKVTPFVAEFWCTASNIGFIAVGVSQNSTALTFAGTASIVSHAIPKQWLLTIDKIGAVAAFAALACEYEVIINNPSVIVSLAALGVIGVTDVYLSRVKGKTWPHVAWHLSAAAVANHVLELIPK